MDDHSYSHSFQFSFDDEFRAKSFSYSYSYISSPTSQPTLLPTFATPQCLDACESIFDETGDKAAVCGSECESKCVPCLQSYFRENICSDTTFTYSYGYLTPFEEFCTPCDASFTDSTMDPCDSTLACCVPDVQTWVSQMCDGTGSSTYEGGTYDIYNCLLYTSPSPRD